MLGFVRTHFLLDRIIIWLFWLCVLHAQSPFQTDCSRSFIIETPQGIVSFVERKSFMCFKRLDFCFQEQWWRTLCLKWWEGFCFYFCVLHIPRFGKYAIGYWVGGGRKSKRGSIKLETHGWGSLKYCHDCYYPWTWCRKYNWKKVGTFVDSMVEGT